MYIKYSNLFYMDVQSPGADSLLLQIDKIRYNQQK